MLLAAVRVVPAPLLLLLSMDPLLVRVFCSFAPPKLTNGTIRFHPGGKKSTVVQSNTTVGDLIAFDGDHFGVE